MLLEAQNLRVRYAGAAHDALAVDHLAIGAHEQVRVIGRSGSGKSTLGLAILQLLPAGATCAGNIAFNGAPVTQALRGKHIAWIPQDVTALSPYFTIQKQLAEVAQIHAKLSRRDANAKAAERIAKLGIDPLRLRDHPHKWSGGMLQRALVVMATMAEPELIIADEPTASLDSAAKSAVADMLAPYAALLITHDTKLAPQARTIALEP